MFDAMAEWMTVPLLNEEGGNPFKRIGLAHPTIAPYGVFKTRDGADILIAIQNDREWRVLAEKVLGDKSLAGDPRIRDGPEAAAASRRNRRQGRRCVCRARRRAADEKARAADIAFARVNDSALLSNASASAAHHGRRAERAGAHAGADAAARGRGARRYGAVPALGEHTEMVRKEFSAK